MELHRVAQRAQEFEMVRWDGKADTGQWATEHFGDAATINGEGDDLTLLMWGSWEIPRGDYLIDQWGTFGYAPADQVGSQYQLAEPMFVPEPLPGPPAEELPAEEPIEPPAEEPPAEPVPDAPPEPETQQ